jgi:hypothetical protein
MIGALIKLKKNKLFFIQNMAQKEEFILKGEVRELRQHHQRLFDS